MNNKVCDGRNVAVVFIGSGNEVCCGTELITLLPTYKRTSKIFLTVVTSTLMYASAREEPFSGAYQYLV
jgi:hypothetical protein